MPLLSVLVTETDNVGTLTVDGEAIGVTAKIQQMFDEEVAAGS